LLELKIDRQIAKPAYLPINMHRDHRVSRMQHPVI
jgi:hypothetical protein